MRMNSISFADAEKLLQRWHSNSITVRIILGASNGPTMGGIITEVQSSPGQIVIAIYLLREGIDKRLVLRDCTFLGSGSEILASFNDGRALRLREAKSPA